MLITWLMNTGLRYADHVANEQALDHVFAAAYTRSLAELLQIIQSERNHTEEILLKEDVSVPNDLGHKR